MDRMMYQLNEFLDYFEQVFGSDWEFTMTRIADAKMYGIERSFIVTDTYDEENNWANRARLLTSYRELVSLMVKRGLRQTTFPDGP